MGFQWGDVSPAAGMMTGEGMLGEAMQKGFGGLLPMTLARHAASKEEEEKKQQEAARAQMSGQPMKKGGKVKAKSGASKRGDGCAQRGKTKGRFV